MLTVLATTVVLIFLYMDSPQDVWSENGSILETKFDFHQHRFVSISSDDWGHWADSAPRWPNFETFLRFLQEGFPGEEVYKAWAFASLDTTEDVYDLGEFIKSMNKDVHPRQQAVITPFFIMGGPDIQAMKELGCPLSERCQYREMLWDSSDGGHSRAPFNRGLMRPLYQLLFREGVWHPEYHGRSHIAPKKWVSLLKTDKIAQKCFEAGLVCSGEYTGLRSENIDGWKNPDDLYLWHKRGVEAFQHFWGYTPRVMNCPHNVSHPDQALVLQRLGFLASETFLNESRQPADAPHTTNPMDFFQRHHVSYLDRVRWDVMWEEFEIEDRLEKLSKKELAKERFVILMWHLQSWAKGIYSEEFVKHIRGSLERTIRYIRIHHPDVVFVTSGELHQIRKQGWSIEVWHDHLRLRNYSPGILTLTIPNLSDFFHPLDKQEEEKADWSGLTVEVEDLDAKSGETVYVGKVGDTVKLSPNKEFVFRAKDSKLHRLPPGPRLDHRSAFSNRFPLPEDGYRPRGK